MVPQRRSGSEEPALAYYITPHNNGDLRAVCETFTIFFFVVNDVHIKARPTWFVYGTNGNASAA